MTKITLISDTHSLLANDVIDHLKEADEIWHAGDIGDSLVLDKLEEIAKTKAVYGNIDTKDIQLRSPKDLIFEIEGFKIYITHIGGYPSRYTKRVYAQLKKHQPDIYICGHSHILKVMKDKDLGILHMNPGACGVIGFHQFRTILKFELDAGEIKNLQAVELGLRGQFRSEPI